MILACALAMASGCGTRPEAASAGPPVLAIMPCEIAGIAGAVECGTLQVAEDRAAPGREIPIYFVVARATVRPDADPGFFVTGGPGSAASDAARALSVELAALRAGRDFVFIDQRGTGRSAPLTCATAEGTPLLAPMFDRASAAACRDALEARADLRLYTTSEAIRDVDAVRLALGYERVALHGSS
jgi:pimeloyl-ACP methyl ester carboxylesterase